MTEILIKRTRVLYHYTAARFVPAIKTEGLTKGALPWHRCSRTGEALVIRAFPEQRLSAFGIEKVRASERRLEAMAKQGNAFARGELERLFPGFQWLTTSADWNQPFALLGDLPYAKNSNRITICVPAEQSLGLHRWRDLCERHKPAAAEEINTTAVDWENWFIFHGRIPPSWFMEISRNPGQTVGAGLIQEGSG